MIRNVFNIITSMFVFVGIVLIYGLVLNLTEVPLEQALLEKKIPELKKVSLIIDRRNYKLELYSDTALVKSYKAMFGRNNSTVKKVRDDNVTPIGEYQICSKDTSKLYYKIIRLNYPNLKDASEAYRGGKISREDFNMIAESTRNEDCPPINTPLGSNIGIHGIGDLNFIISNLPFSFNFTNGSIALSNYDVEEIYNATKVGTKVIIRY